jgi:putative membrane protein
MTKRSRLALAVLAAGLLVPFYASAGDKDKPAKGTVSTDQRFVQKAAMGHMTEIRLAQVAQQRASSQAVKDYAERLEQDHSQALEQLKEVASRENITLLDELDSKHQKHIDHFSKLSGEQFDRAFMQHMIKDHKEEIALFERQASQGREPELKTYASNTLPKLREHLNMATEIQGDIQKTTGRSQ